MYTGGTLGKFACMQPWFLHELRQASRSGWTQETRLAVRVLVTQQLDLAERGARAAVRKCDVMARADMREESGLGALMCAGGHLGIAPWGCAWRVSMHVLGHGSGSVSAMKRQNTISVGEALCSGRREGDDYRADEATSSGGVVCVVCVVGVVGVEAYLLSD